MSVVTEEMVEMALVIGQFSIIWGGVLTVTYVIVKLTIWMGLYL